MQADRRGGMSQPGYNQELNTRHQRQQDRLQQQKHSWRLALLLQHTLRIYVNTSMLPRASRAFSSRSVLEASRASSLCAILSLDVLIATREFLRSRTAPFSPDNLPRPACEIEGDRSTSHEPLRDVFIWHEPRATDQPTPVFTSSN